MFIKFGFKPQLIPTLFTIPALILLFSLSFWQFHRLNWKINLINEIAARIELPQIDLPSNVEINSMAYRKVKLMGQYLNNLELFLYGGSLEFKGQNGYYILTPFKTDDGRIIIINRGWIPESLKNKDKRPETILDKEEIVEGFIMQEESRGLYVHDNQPNNNLWFYINIQEIEDFLKLPIENYYILAKQKPNSLPVGRNITPNIRNNHLGYALTWLFAAISLIVIYTSYHKKNHAKI